MYSRISLILAGRRPRLRMTLSPLPMPKKARPPDISFSVAMADAATAGCLVRALVTVGPMRTLVVALATTLKLRYNSRQSDWESGMPM